ncbi:MAG TPA: hypothetical protein VIA62_21460 [Thermoanaerobaculia bacterium]|jgi:hypothetical protein|nr:hypothetical protein [Thermoanaerobaculia bacterium]
MRPLSVPWWSLLLVSLAFSPPSWAQGKPALTITFEESAVVASGLSPGKTVIWFGVERRLDAEYSSRLAQRYLVGTAAADGTARFVLDQPVAHRSIWTAVDLDTGGFAVAAPPGYRLNRLKNPPCRLGPGLASRPDEILDDRPYLMGLVVRPAVGAWSFVGGDGGARDEDGVNDGHLRFALSKLDPLPGSPAAPARATGVDLWFVIDPQRMEISVHQGGVAQ